MVTSLICNYDKLQGGPKKLATIKNHH